MCPSVLRHDEYPENTGLGRRGHRINLADVLSKDFEPRLFNGTWVTDPNWPRQTEFWTFYPRSETCNSLCPVHLKHLRYPLSP
ncbi:hypothetical protein TNCV_2713981 [Trichonephila clavipes]|nr:hypothetical protein TNCV_2713981 [Trichonephila clavipes]